ncbi:MAG: hypothetical protein K6F00_04960 [Lachnospiraceae bacterium]|nr:hypothetical protein [Lachnospiraceae bacterium]
MVSAGRVLIVPKGEWTNLTSYEMLDLVSEGDKAYLARQASVGMRPSEDISMTYWQPFGSSASIATTDTPGLVMPDGVTITVDATGLIVASLNVSDLKDIKITNLASGDFLKYDGTQSKWVNVALGTAAYKASTNAVTQNSTDLVESGGVFTVTDSLNTALANKVNTSAIANNLTTTASGSVLDARQGKTLSDTITNKHKITRKTVNTSSWSTDTSSQSGTTLYKKSISLSHVYVDSPSVDISTSSGTGLPTTAQQTAYDLLQYVTIDGTTMYLYASAVPSDTFYIQIEGVD